MVFGLRTKYAIVLFLGIVAALVASIVLFLLLGNWTSVAVFSLILLLLLSMGLAYSLYRFSKNIERRNWRLARRINDHVDQMEERFLKSFDGSRAEIDSLAMEQRQNNIEVNSALKSLDSSLDLARASLVKLTGGSLADQKSVDQIGSRIRLFERRILMESSLVRDSLGDAERLHDRRSNGDFEYRMKLDRIVSGQRDLARRQSSLERNSGFVRNQTNVESGQEQIHFHDFESKLKNIALSNSQFYSNVEALILTLKYIGQTESPLPQTGGWALDAQGLLAIIEMMQDSSVNTVLEIGSGVSTVWLGYVARNRGTRLISVEHNEVYYDKTKRMLVEHGLNDTVDLVYAPLESLSIGDESYNWYSRAALSGITAVDLLLVDGPPKASGIRARYPAIPILTEAMSPACTVLLDDCNREDERMILERWLNDFPDFSQQKSHLKRFGILRRDE